MGLSGRLIQAGPIDRGVPVRSLQEPLPPLLPHLLSFFDGADASHGGLEPQAPLYKGDGRVSLFQN